jgi:hypothetical protein
MLGILDVVIGAAVVLTGFSVVAMAVVAITSHGKKEISSREMSPPLLPWKADMMILNLVTLAGVFMSTTAFCHVPGSLSDAVLDHNCLSKDGDEKCTSKELGLDA